MSDTTGGGWSIPDERSGWTLDPSQAERVHRVNVAASERIDAAQAHYPRCPICGQRTLRGGICSRSGSWAHREHFGEVRDGA